MALDYLALATFAVLATTIPPSAASPAPAWIRSVARGQAGATPAAGSFRDVVAAQLRGAGAGGRARRAAGAQEACEEAKAWSDQMDAACPKQCDSDGDPSVGLAKCEDGQDERTPSSCGTQTCADYLSTVDEGKLATLSGGYAQCGEEGEDGLLRGLLGGAGGPKMLQVLTEDVARSCGKLSAVDLPPRPAGASCMDSISFSRLLDTQCPKQCESGDQDGENEELPTCEDGQPERSREKCGTDGCSELFAGLTANRVAQLEAGYQQCLVEGDSMNSIEDSMVAFFSSLIFGANPGFLGMLLSGVASQCGQTFEGGGGDGGCQSYVNQISQFDSKCPKQCRDEDEGEDTGLPLCEEGQPQYTRSTCGTEACSDHLTKMLSKESRCGAKSCDGTPYAIYAQAFDNDLYVAHIASECGLWEDVDVEWSPAARSCHASKSFGTELESACPKTCCGDDDGDCQLRKCDDGENEFSISDCGIDSCSSYLSELTADDIGALVCGLRACSPDSTSDSDLPGVDEIQRIMTGLAAQCGFSNKYTVDLTDFSVKCPEVSGGPVECRGDANDDAPTQTTTVSESTTSTGNTTSEADSDAATRYSVQSTVATLLAVTACVVAAVL